jgi:hypothetical protein
MNVWDKTPMAMTKSKMNSTSLPSSFTSQTPGGEDEIYDRWNVPTITIQSSSGKKYTHKPVAYKSRSGLSVLTYTSSGWEGYHQNKSGKFYSMSLSGISEDTIPKKQIETICEPSPTPPVEKTQQTMKSVAPPVGLALSNADFYNQSITINKVCSVYVEVANDLHVRLGTNLTTTQNWVTNLFLGISRIYSNEGINIFLTSVYVWETVDPYGYSTATSSINALNSFTTNINSNLPVNPNANFRHLLNNKSLGGIAWLGGGSDGYTPGYGGSAYYRCAFSGISPTTLPSTPTDISSYNWALYVVAHETGHNMGSNHTQNCRWKNDAGVSIGRLDSCYGGETYNGISCGTSTKNSTVPTIMSYCHLTGTPTTILSRGFGRYPRFAIRSSLYNSSDIPFSNVVLSTLTTTSVSSITSSTATSGGNITNEGGGTVLSRGICWSTSQNPTIQSPNITNNGTGSGSFTSSLTGLLASTTYYVRSYATNQIGTAYGSQVSFTTSSAVVPSLTTTSISSITNTAGTSGGTIINDGGSAITSKGVCWSTSPNPTVSLTTKTNNGTGTSTFTSNITGLSGSTTYYVRSYATNAAGTGYGNEVTFTTSSSSVILITTTPISGLACFNASSGGSITSDGGAAITARGVCWSTTTNPTTANSKTTNGTGTGTFTSALTNLSANTTYYLRSYATNTSGTTYGSQITFSTPPLPVITASTPTGVTYTSFTVPVAITASSVNNNLISSGVYTSLSNPPTTSNFYRQQTSVSTTVGNYTYTFSTSNGFLSAGTTYYIRPYLLDNYLNYYWGNTVVATTPPGTAAVCTTYAVSGVSTPTVSTSSATLSGKITLDGGVISSYGICYGTTSSPTITGTKVSSTCTSTACLQTFSSTVTNLTPNTTYYARFFATNEQGTSYGNEVTFTTPVYNYTGVPLVTTNAITSIISTGATFSGTVTNNGGSNCSALSGCRGWAYSSSNPNPTRSDLYVDESVNTQTIAGTFTRNATGLTPGTTYYVRAYAQNGQGYGYGSAVSFTTSTTTTSPVVTTTAISGITTTGAASGGNITSDGGSIVSTKGVVWSISTNPTISLSTKTSNGTGTGTYSSSITGLTANTTYYVRAYATNAIGTSYGSQLSFTTTASSTTPTVTTSTTSSITGTTATSGGNVTSDGGATVTARGVCWSTTQNPTISLSTKTSDGTGSGTFTSSITGLSTGTLYYVRAYATNANGTVYGTQVSFTTLVNLPTLTTTSISSASLTGGVSGGNITSDGGAPVTARGVCFATTQNPTISNTKTSDGTGSGSFTSNLTSLTSGTVYYVRAYATNSAGTAYGNQVSFSTTAPTIPTVTTTSISSISFTTASSGGNVTSDGNATVTSKGVCWSTTTTPTISNFLTNDGTGTGSFTSSITGLTPGTTYYLRAYATNSAGTGYGSQVSFTATSGATPTVTTDEVSVVTSTSATVLYSLTSLGGGTISSRGFCYSTSPNPTTSSSKVEEVCSSEVSCDLGQFSSTTLVALTPNLTYYVRAFAINEYGTSYGSELNFTTPINLPTVTTTSISAITTTAASSGGTVTSVGGGTVSARGVCWSTTSGPTILDTKTTNGSGSGSFTSSLTGLSSSTTYYVRAYATNEGGTSYGSEVTFTTSSIGFPVLTTSSISSITSSSAVSGGNITSDGNATVTSRGVCWSTSINPTTSNNTTSDGTGTGSFSSSITGLSAGTVYYVRAYAINTAGTSYGNQVSFTSSASIPTLSTTSISGITSTSASSGGSITNSGGSTVTTKGVVWSTTTNPTTSLSTKTNNGSGTGTFTSTLTGLTPSTVYYVRSYATNTAGTGYGNQVSFTTSSSGSGSCQVTNLTAFKVGSQWNFKFDINSNCNTYTVNVCRYSITNPSTPPSAGATPIACGVRNSMSAYTPSASERTAGFIQRSMSPQPSGAITSGFGSYWYSVDVKCNATSCSGPNTTRFYFFVPGI